MRLVGDKIILRYPKMSDARWLFKQTTSPDIKKNLGPIVAHIKSAKDEIRRIKQQPQRRKKGEKSFVIVDKRTKELIGECSINHRWKGNNYAEACWWVAPPYRGKGYALDAVTTLLSYGFSSLGIHRVEAYIYEFNPRSVAFAKKLGFNVEGCMKERYNVGNIFYDEYVIGLLKKDFLRHRKLLSTRKSIVRK